MKKIFIILICLLTFVGCTKKVDPIIEQPPIIREDNEEMLLYGNTLANINGDIPVVETKEYIYYVYLRNTILRINRENLEDVSVIYENDMDITNIAYSDEFLYFIEKDEDGNAQLSRLSLQDTEKEVFHDVDSYDNILVILEEKIYYVNTQSYYEKCNLDGSKAQLFGLTMIIHPSFNGGYFFGAGYEMTASDDRMRIFRTDYKNDTSVTFYEKTVASIIIPNPFGYVIFENSGAQYIFHTLDSDGSHAELQEYYLNYPFSRVVKGNYYGSYSEEDSYYEYNPETKTLTVIDATNENYAVWKIYALGTPTEEFVLIETNDNTLYYHIYDSGKAVQLYPVSIEAE